MCSSDLSTASLMIGVASARADNFIITAGLAGIAAGALSMAVGEYVSVSSQNDIEDADRRLEEEHLRIDPEGELEELAHIYEKRGLPKELAMQVAIEMHKGDALEAHLRDELGQFEHTKARPVQAAIASALSFTAGGFVPFLGALAPTLGAKALSIVAITLVGLLVSGIVSARTAGAPLGKTTLRVFLGGSIGMAIKIGRAHV